MRALSWVPRDGHRCLTLHARSALVNPVRTRSAFHVPAKQRQGSLEMNDLLSLRAHSEDARAYAELVSAQVDEAVARMRERTTALERAPTEGRDRRRHAGPGERTVRFGCRVALCDDTIRLDLVGELDVAAVATIEETWAQVVRFAETRVVVDLSQLRFIDSSGMHALLRLRGGLARSVRLELIRGPECVDRVFALTGLQPLFTFVDCVD